MADSIWLHSSVFVLKKYPTNLKFQRFLKEGLVATFNEKRAPIFRKFVVEQDKIMPNYLQALQCFCSHSSGFGLEIQPENLSFQSFLPIKEVLVAAINEVGAPTSR